MITITLNPELGKLVLKFPYRPQLIEKIKEFEDRQFNPATKAWEVGFNSSSLPGIIESLAKYTSASVDTLNKIEGECKQYLAKHHAAINANLPVFNTLIKPTLMQIGELIIKAYIAGTITQQQQGQMLEIINHLSLKDFIR